MMKILATTAFLTLAIGSFFATLIFLWPSRVDTQSGQLLYIGTLASLPDEPWCDESLRFCIAQPEQGEVVAFYGYETHPRFRDQGCTIRWEPERAYYDSKADEERRGAFYAPCSSSIFDRSGDRVFGPAPRDLDHFPVIVLKGEVFLDMSALICGGGPREGYLLASVMSGRTRIRLPDRHV